MCKVPGKTTTGQDIFRIIDEYIGNKIDWKKCVGICTDGAASMTGRNSGVVKRIKEKSPSAKWYHCFLHGAKNFVAKKMSTPLSEVMGVVVKIINFINHNALNSRVFAMREMGCHSRTTVILQQG